MDNETVRKLASDVLLGLPEWSIYIENPDKKFGGSNLFGFWVHLDHDANNHWKEIRFVLDTDEMLMPVPIHIGNWSLEEAPVVQHQEFIRLLWDGKWTQGR